MAKCDFSPLDFAQKCPQNAGNTISENKFENVSGGGKPPDPPTDVLSLWPNVPGAPNLSCSPQLNRSQNVWQHATVYRY